MSWQEYHTAEAPEAVPFLLALSCSLSVRHRKIQSICSERTVYSATPPLNNNVITRLSLAWKDAFEVPSKMRRRYQSLAWTSCLSGTNRILIFWCQKWWPGKLVGLCVFSKVTFPNPDCIDSYFQGSACMELGWRFNGGITSAQQHLHMHFL